MRVKCSLTLSTCLSNELALQQNVTYKTGQEVSSAKRLASCSACARCIDAWSCGQSSMYATKYAIRTYYYYWGEPQASPTVTCWLGFLSRYIYIDRPTAVFDPAPGVKVGCCGRNLRVVTLCENDLLYWHMFLHIRLRHWSNLSEFNFCVRLSALNHSAKK